jgi:large subunit ribosomal protein L29
MKAADLRELPLDELAHRLNETTEELFNLRFQHATGQLENYATLSRVRRDVARIRSIQHERELGLSPEPTPEQAEIGRRRREVDDEADARRSRRRGLRRRGSEAGTGDVEEAVGGESDETDNGPDGPDEETEE